MIGYHHVIKCEHLKMLTWSKMNYSGGGGATIKYMLNKKDLGSYRFLEKSYL